MVSSEGLLGVLLLLMAKEPPWDDVEVISEIGTLLAPSSPKLSLFKIFILLFVLSSFTVIESAVAVGKSFTAFTVMVTVAVELSPFASWIL
jgi:hypothetical protein